MTVEPSEVAARTCAGRTSDLAIAGRMRHIVNSDPAFPMHVVRFSTLEMRAVLAALEAERAEVVRLRTAITEHRACVEALDGALAQMAADRALWAVLAGADTEAPTP